MSFRPGDRIEVINETFHATVISEHRNTLMVHIFSSTSGTWSEDWNREHTLAAIRRGEYKHIPDRREMEV